MVRIAIAHKQLTTAYFTDRRALRVGAAPLAGSHFSQSTGTLRSASRAYIIMQQLKQGIYNQLASKSTRR